LVAILAAWMGFVPGETDKSAEEIGLILGLDPNRIEQLWHTQNNLWTEIHMDVGEMPELLPSLSIWLSTCLPQQRDVLAGIPGTD